MGFNTTPYSTTVGATNITLIILLKWLVKSDQNILTTGLPNLSYGMKTKCLLTAMMKIVPYQFMTENVLRSYKNKK